MTNILYAIINIFFLCHKDLMLNLLWTFDKGVYLRIQIYLCYSFLNTGKIFLFINLSFHYISPYSLDN
ncbi:hypothetical protein SAMN04488055_1248 [Chitinophaga niabensis]|uniref:Uncharacterized protein n=1 Tax=Chitinophaga niabensis TaxID=536979 RepID=A0A1N6E207_9BACT|nr:hypothetical protein SAMN04488055_1248 [Chitinophaga niabensis]